MATFRIETISDGSSGRVFAEIYRDPAGLPIARSGPVYASHAEAEERVLDAISKAWPSQPVDPVYPANGS